MNVNWHCGFLDPSRSRPEIAVSNGSRVPFDEAQHRVGVNVSMNPKGSANHESIRDIRRRGIWVVVLILIWSVGWFAIHHRVTEARHVGDGTR